MKQFDSITLNFVQNEWVFPSRIKSTNEIDLTKVYSLLRLNTWKPSWVNLWNISNIQYSCTHFIPQSTLLLTYFLNVCVLNSIYHKGAFFVISKGRHIHKQAISPKNIFHICIWWRENYLGCEVWIVNWTILNRE